MRSIIHAVYTQLKRGKMIEPLHGFLPLVVDGHEVCASYDRHCRACLRRTVNGRTQYYHRVVAAQLVTRRFCLTVARAILAAFYDWLPGRAARSP